jgi:hypothetical protein
MVVAALRLPEDGVLRVVPGGLACPVTGMRDVRGTAGRRRQPGAGGICYNHPDCQDQDQDVGSKQHAADHHS